MRWFTILALLVAIALGTVLSPWASTSPDGLSRVAEDHNFRDQATLASAQADAPALGYSFPGVENERIAKGIAGFGGTLGAFAFGYGIASVIRRRLERREERLRAS